MIHPTHCHSLVNLSFLIYPIFHGLFLTSLAPIFQIQEIILFKLQFFLLFFFFLFISPGREYVCRVVFLFFYKIIKRMWRRFPGNAAATREAQGRNGRAHPGLSLSLRCSRAVWCKYTNTNVHGNPNNGWERSETQEEKQLDCIHEQGEAFFSTFINKKIIINLAKFTN